MGPSKIYQNQGATVPSERFSLKIMFIKLKKKRAKESQ